MPLANPFNKDKQAIEEELKRKKDIRDKYYNEGHYFPWLMSNIQYYLFQYPAVAFYRNQEAKVCNLLVLFKVSVSNGVFVHHAVCQHRDDQRQSILLS